jgi:hypothetical protein
MSNESKMNPVDLPRELQFIIARKLDIDSRRALGIYTKLAIPHHVTRAISKVISNGCKKIGSHLVVNLNNHAYQLVKGYDPCTQDMIDYRVIVHKKTYHMVWCIIDD